MLMVAVRVPVTLGVNVTVSAQLPLGVPLLPRAGAFSGWILFFTPSCSYSASERGSAVPGSVFSHPRVGTLRKVTLPLVRTNCTV
jgi:hypothetical protein